MKKMKAPHILAIVAIAVAVAVLVSSMDDASQYVNFNEAFVMSQNGKKDQIHVVGELKKDPTGKVMMDYNPVLNPNLFSFVMLDEQKREEVITYYGSKPQDFERSEKIVIIGSVRQNRFVADKILMKCPSKYEGQQKKI